MQISFQLMRYHFSRQLHCLILLNLPMAFIHRVLFMDLNKCTMIVVDLLPDSHCFFVDINLFQVTCFPAVPTYNLEPIAPTAIGQLLPVAEFALVLRPSTQLPRSPSSGPRGILW